MNDFISGKPSIRTVGPAIRRVVSEPAEHSMRVEYLQPGQTLPCRIQPLVEDGDAIAWAEANRHFIEAQLLRHGGILFRRLELGGVAEFEQFIRTVAGELLDYSYQSTPRRRVNGNIYTSTEYPANESIPLHNEMAYTHSWPLKIAFYCLTTAVQGGETPIADSRKVFARIDPKIKERFMQRKIMYVRNYRDEIDLPWSTVFQTQSKVEVEAYCRRAGIELQWLDNNHLRTRQVCEAVRKHPLTGEVVWFNQAHLFHISNLAPKVRESLAAIYKEEHYPRNAYYGDGTPIENAVLDHVREAYRHEEISFAWQEGDVLLLDNMLAAHGRRPFTGPRQVVVGMAQPSTPAA
jgi:alpha-ketoglutarate-dependent taurine dioxygenase